MSACRVERKRGIAMKDYPNIDERAWVLLNGQVDGELSGSEQQELDALLVTSKELRTIHAELTGLSDYLQRVPEKVPPAYLHNAITSTVRLPVDESTVSGKRGFSTWLTDHWPGPAFALTAGILLTVGVYETNPDALDTTETANMSGTMVSPSSAQKGELLDRIQVGNNSVSGTAELRKSGREFLVYVQVDSEFPAEFTLDYAANGLEFMGVTSSKNQVNGIIVDQEKVTVEGKGQQRYTLVLRIPGEQSAANVAPLKVGLSVNNGQPYKAELKTVKQ